MVCTSASTSSGFLFWNDYTDTGTFEDEEVHFITQAYIVCSVLVNCPFNMLMCSFLVQTVSFSLSFHSSLTSAWCPPGFKQCGHSPSTSGINIWHHFLHSEQSIIENYLFFRPFVLNLNAVCKPRCSHTALFTPLNSIHTHANVADGFYVIGFACRCVPM